MVLWEELQNTAWNLRGRRRSRLIRVLANPMQGGQDLSGEGEVRRRTPQPQDDVVHGDHADDLPFGVQHRKTAHALGGHRLERTLQVVVRTAGMDSPAHDLRDEDLGRGLVLRRRGDRNVAGEAGRGELRVRDTHHLRHQPALFVAGGVQGA